LGGRSTIWPKSRGRESLVKAATGKSNLKFLRKNPQNTEEKKIRRKRREKSAVEGEVVQELPEGSRIQENKEKHDAFQGRKISQSVNGRGPQTGGDQPREVKGGA